MTTSAPKEKVSTAFVERVGIAFKERRINNANQRPYAFKSRVVFNQSDSEIEDRFRHAFVQWTRKVGNDSANI